MRNEIIEFLLSNGIKIAEDTLNGFVKNAKHARNANRVDYVKNQVSNAVNPNGFASNVQEVKDNVVHNVQQGVDNLPDISELRDTIVNSIQDRLFDAKPKAQRLKSRVTESYEDVVDEDEGLSAGDIVLAGLGVAATIAVVMALVNRTKQYSALYTSKEALDLEGSYLVILAQYLLMYCAPNSSDYIYLALTHPQKAQNCLLFQSEHEHVQELTVSERHSDFFNELFLRWNEDLKVLGEKDFQALSLSIKREGMGLDVHYFVGGKEQEVSLEHKSAREIIDYLIELSSFDI